DHLLDELDRELTETVGRLRVAGPLAFFNPGLPAVGQVDPPAACQPLPSDYLVYVRSPAQGFGVATYCEELYSAQTLPPRPTGLEEGLKLGGDPGSVPPLDDASRWRKVGSVVPPCGVQPGSPLRGDQVVLLVVAQNMAGVDAA